MAPLSSQQSAPKIGLQLSVEYNIPRPATMGKAITQMASSMNTLLCSNQYGQD